jgi:hypothetical protein
MYADTTELIGPVTRATPEEIAHMGARLPNGRKWPFSVMNVGDRVLIDPKLAKPAQGAMRTHAARSFARFASKRDPETGALLVIRLG